uniref:Carbohydrate kinase FGGY C-terminal domain-containing protein n=3 Tax=Hemiselmis andersenii TaxID=464988 RepID=A0A7S1HBX3_HEMAN|mmetsp:Transcript_49507/g.120082  ORF Transcript_49507/g.120082 Transcript_49507/m.120082 type:complete len:496 (+) Transcript_49507:50-1537(+)
MYFGARVSNIFLRAFTSLLLCFALLPPSLAFSPPLTGGLRVSLSPSPRLATSLPRRSTGGLYSVIMASHGLGFDFGTSGVRINVVSSTTLEVVHADSRAYSEQSADVWSNAMDELLLAIPEKIRSDIDRISVSGTSASVLLATPSGASRGPRMYDFSVVGAPKGEEAMAMIKREAPAGHCVRSATSSLAKVLCWGLEEPIEKGVKVAHQADFLAHRLTGEGAPVTSDWNNMLKFGYDPMEDEYPGWVKSLTGACGLGTEQLPRVVPPGGLVGEVCEEARQKYGLTEGCRVMGGTTDSIAAFIAAGTKGAGEAVTSLGSTIAIKLLSETRIDESDFGVYSHRLGDVWLVGGSSNVGCAVLRQQKFTGEEMADLSAGIDPLSPPPEGIRYYPLTKVGERFPVNDPSKQPVLTPVPDSRKDFLHGLLHGIAEVERDGYKVLAKMGASEVTKVLTAGGGSVNPTWTKMREGMIGCTVERAANSDAAYGVALLALGRHLS